MKNKLTLLSLVVLLAFSTISAQITGAGTTLPANSETGVSILPSFSWDSGGPFIIEIATSSSFGGTIVFTTASTSSPYQLTAANKLNNNTFYYWRFQGGTGYNEIKTVNAAKPTINPIYPGVTSAYVGWYPVPYSSGLKYDLVCSTTSDMLTPIVTSGSTGLTNTYYTITGLAQSTNYWVQVRTTNSTGTVIISYSDVYGPFQVASPPVPTPSYPTDNTADGDVYANPPTLFWYIEGNEPSLTYEVEVKEFSPTNVAFDGTTGIEITAAGKTFKRLSGTPPLPLTAGRTYKWRVRSVADPTHKSGWSTPDAKFKIYSNVATSAIIPTPSWPVGTTAPTVYQNPPTLYWYLGSDKTGLYYQVQYDTQADFLSGSAVTYPADGSFTTNLFLALPTALIPGTTYYWRVRSDLDNSAAGASGWSSNGSFVVASTASGGAATPIPSWPVGGAIMDGPMANITLSWTAVSTQPLSFKVRIATSSSVDGTGTLNHGSAVENSYVASTTSANAQSVFGSLTAGTTYYWQVKSKLTADPPLVESPWSMVASFSTAAGASSVVPLIVSPNFLQPLNNTVAVLTWNIPVQSESPLKYDLQYSKNSNFSNAVTVPNLNNPSALVSGLETNSTYYWRVLSKTNTGSISSYSTTGTFKTNAATSVEERNTIPADFELAQNYPNPFNPTTRINFSIPQNSFVSLRIYDILGREVKTLIDRQMTAGSHSVEWNADNNLGGKVSTGMYIYRITAGSPSSGSEHGFVATKKMSFIK